MRRFLGVCAVLGAAIALCFMLAPRDASPADSTPRDEAPDEVRRRIDEQHVSTERTAALRSEEAAQMRARAKEPESLAPPVSDERRLSSLRAFPAPSPRSEKALARTARQTQNARLNDRLARRIAALEARLDDMSLDEMNRDERIEAEHSLKSLRKLHAFRQADRVLASSTRAETRPVLDER